MSYKNERGQHVCYLSSQHDNIGAEYRKHGRGKYYVYQATIPANRPFCWVRFTLIGIVSSERKARQLCRTIIVAHEDKPRVWCTSQIAIFGLGMDQSEINERESRFHPSSYDFRPY